MTDWFVNQKVVCVNDKLSRPYLAMSRRGHAFPKARVVYVVREVLLYEFVEGPEVALRLREIVNPVDHWDDGYSAELAFWAGRFRPLINPETDLSQFEALLRGGEQPAGKRELVEA